MTTTSTPRSTLAPSGLTLGVDTSTAVCVGLARGGEGRRAPDTPPHDPPALVPPACHECRPPGAAEVDPETLHHLWLLAHGYPTDPTNAQRQEGHRLARAHLQWHMERNVSALQVMEQ